MQDDVDGEHQDQRGEDRRPDAIGVVSADSAIFATRILLNRPNERQDDEQDLDIFTQGCLVRFCSALWRRAPTAEGNFFGSRKPMGDDTNLAGFIFPGKRFLAEHLTIPANVLSSPRSSTHPFSKLFEKSSLLPSPGSVFRLPLIPNNYISMMG